MTRLLSIAAVGLMWTLPSMAGEPVLLPDFTPATTSDFSLAALLQQVTEDGLARSGHVVLVDDVVENVIGSDTLDACFDEPACPGTALGKLPARFGVVVRVRQDSGRVFGDLQIYEQTGSDPIEETTIEVVSGEEDKFGREIADRVNDLAMVMGPANANDVLSAAKLIASYQARQAAGNAATADPDAVVVVRKPIDGTGSSNRTGGTGQTGGNNRTGDTNGGSGGAQEGGDGTTGAGSVSAGPAKPTTPEGKLNAAFDDTGFQERHLVGVKDHFLDSDADIRDWNAENTPHAGRAILEVRGGLGLGDVDRIAHVRNTFDEEGAESAWFQEGPLPANRIRGELFVGYAPSAWIDVGVLFGLQYGQRVLDAGWTDAEGGSSSSEDQAQAAQFVIQPRLRFYPIRTGPLKPYLFVGADLRFFDRWGIVPVDGVTYAEPPGGLVPGPLGGVGLMVDPSPMVGLFVEGSFAYPLGTRAVSAETSLVPEPSSAPSPVEVDGRVISVVGGVQFRL